MVFRGSNQVLAADDSWRYVLSRHISFFAHEDELNGLLQWIGQENPFFERIIDVVSGCRKAKKEETTFWEVAICGA
jgi:hypothetical protein